MARTLNPFSQDFQLSTCDGPTINGTEEFIRQWNETHPGYVPCDFRGFMGQAQFLINTMIVVGILAAVVGFCYAGFLYITGEQAKITKAKDIFLKTVVGLIMMLSAWVIVYQLISWLASSGGVSVLLGK